jgi:hypothetical protein
MKTCPLCNKPIEHTNSVVAILAGKYLQDENAPEKYTLEVTRQAILSHMVCP